jgi:hypothetical protein
MSGSFARFRDLRGIGPATEARLHATGIYTWDALAVAPTALAAVRGEGDTPRDVANAVAARCAESEGSGGVLRIRDGGERLESFLLRVALTSDGAPQRSEVTHVRTKAEHVWSGWSPGELATFVQQHLPVSRGASEDASTPDDSVASRTPRRSVTRPRTTPSSDHLVVLDAGLAIGGASRDITLAITTPRAAGGDVAFRATLAARALGNGRNGEGWTTLARHTGSASPAGKAVLEFRRFSCRPGSIGCC